MRNLKKPICLCLIFIYIIVPPPAGIGAASTPKEPEFAPGEVIVGFEDIKTDARDAIKGRGGKIIKEISALKALVVKVPVGEEKKFIQNLRSLPGFRYAERNGRVRAVSTFSGDWDGTVQSAYAPSDPGWDYQWNMRIIEADDAWDIHMGSTGVAIAIVDSGVDYEHVDLAAHYISGGYDWVNNDKDPWDDYGHGTHCAGIAAMVMDNGYGGTGVVQCSIWSEKVLDEHGWGFWDDLAYGVVHATDGGVDVISMSLGGYSYSSLMESACSYAWSRGVLLVAAAGNYNLNMDAYPHYPASYETVMAISGTDSSDKRYSSSNYGSDIEVAAPGVMIPSTIPGNSYTYMTGTSMSTPHVAGVAALTWSYDPSLTNVQLRERLHQAVDDLGDPGWDPYFGYGRINAYKALTGAPEFEYNLRLRPFVEIIRFNVGPDYWLSGVIEGPGYSRPVLGKAEDGYGYFGCDPPPWADYEMAFFYISVTTGKGYMYRIRDDLSLTGPTYVWATSVTGGSVEGPTLVEGEGSEVAPATWYDLRMNPWLAIYHISDDIAPGLWGCCEAPGPAFPAPVLGYARGNRFYLATDTKDGTIEYEISFEAGTISTGKGSLIVTRDGYSYAGPYNFWFTEESSEAE